MNECVCGARIQPTISKHSAQVLVVTRHIRDESFKFRIINITTINKNNKRNLSLGLRCSADYNQKGKIAVGFLYHFWTNSEVVLLLSPHFRWFTRTGISKIRRSNCRCIKCYIHRDWIREEKENIHNIFNIKYNQNLTTHVTLNSSLHRRKNWTQLLTELRVVSCKNVPNMYLKLGRMWIWLGQSYLERFVSIMKMFARKMQLSSLWFGFRMYV